MSGRSSRSTVTSSPTCSPATPRSPALPSVFRSPSTNCSHGDAAGHLLQAFERNPPTVDRIQDAAWASGVYAGLPADSVWRQPAGPGWALVGDAGTAQDPWAGLGMDTAARQAEAFVEAFTTSPDDWHGSYTHLRRERTYPGYRANHPAGHRPAPTGGVTQASSFRTRPARRMAPGMSVGNRTIAGVRPLMCCPALWSGGVGAEGRSDAPSASVERLIYQDFITHSRGRLLVARSLVVVVGAESGDEGLERLLPKGFGVLRRDHAARLGSGQAFAEDVEGDCGIVCAPAAESSCRLQADDAFLTRCPGEGGGWPHPYTVPAPPGSPGVTVGQTPGRS